MSFQDVLTEFSFRIDLQKLHRFQRLFFSECLLTQDAIRNKSKYGPWEYCSFDFQEMWKYQVDYCFWWHISLSVDYSFLNQKGENIFWEKNMILSLKIAQYSKSLIDEQYLSKFLIALKASFLKQKVIPTVLLLLIYFDFGPIRWNIS